MARSAPHSVRPSSPGIGGPAQSPPSQVPPRSRRRAPSGCAGCTGALPGPPRRAAPRRTRARPHASASLHRVHSQCVQWVSPQHARMRCTCNLRTSSRNARTYRVHVRCEHPPVLTQRACTHDGHTHQCKHTSPYTQSVIHIGYSFSVCAHIFTACEQSAQTPRAHMGSPRTHVLTHRAHTSSQGSHTCTHTKASTNILSAGALETVPGQGLRQVPLESVPSCPDAKGLPNKPVPVF